MCSVCHIVSAAVSRIQVQHPASFLDWHLSSDHPRANQCCFSITDQISYRQKMKTLMRHTHQSITYTEFGDPNSQRAQSALGLRAVKAQRMLSRARQACTSPKRDPRVQLQAERNSTQRGHKEALTDPTLGAAPYYPYCGITMFPAFGSVTRWLNRRSVDSSNLSQFLWGGYVSL